MSSIIRNISLTFMIQKYDFEAFNFYTVCTFSFLFVKQYNKCDKQTDSSTIGFWTLATLLL